MFFFLPQSFSGSNQNDRGQKSVKTQAMCRWFRTPDFVRTRAPFVALSSLLLLAACAHSAPGGAGANYPVASGATDAAARSSNSAPSTGTPTPSAGAAPNTAFLPRQPEITLDPKAPLAALPELKVENIGLHVGGGPNDAETKAPFQRAIAARFPAFLDCYRKNEDPEKGGRFGIDLHISRAGGHPKLEQPRTAMRGPEFRACVVSVFESVEFEKPKLGPTTISYSLHFTLGEGS
jgi:hypothetical protein